MRKITRSDFLRVGGLSLASALTTLPARVHATTHQPVFDMRDFENWILNDFQSQVKIGPKAGHYARKPGEPLELYGIADMVSILYTLNRLSPNAQQKQEWAEAFQQFQRASDGWLIEADPTHDPLHNTAFAVASMQLLDLTPAHNIMPPANDAPAEFLNGLDWENNVYLGSHRGAGLASLRYNVPSLFDRQWFHDYFNICDSLFDPDNGLMGRNKPDTGDFDQVGGTFHYAFLYETFNRRMPYPKARIDSVLGLQQADGYWHPANRIWLTLDALYLLTRGLRHTPHRFDDVRKAVRQLMTSLMDDVFSVEGRIRSFSGKLPTHTVMAALSIAAEAQQFLGDHEVITTRPLRLVLDRRPFI